MNPNEYMLGRAQRGSFNKRFELITNRILESIFPDSRPWRVDWFGEVKYTEPLRQEQRYLQPRIQVAISAMQAPPESIRSSPKNFIPESPQHRTTIWLPVICLGRLRIGEIWQSGAQVGFIQDDSLSLKGIRVRTDTTKLISGISLLEDYGPDEYPLVPWNDSIFESYFVTIDISNGKTIAIPGSVVIGSYFFNHCGLLHLLFTGPFQEQRLYHEFSYDRKIHRWRLQLAAQISRDELMMVLRIINQKHVRRSAAWIYNSCVKATSQGKPAYPYTYLPLCGNTDLMIWGTWAPCSHKCSNIFLVSYWLAPITIYDLSRVDFE